MQINFLKIDSHLNSMYCLANNSDPRRRRAAIKSKNSVAELYAAKPYLLLLGPSWHQHTRRL